MQLLKRKFYSMSLIKQRIKFLTTIIFSNFAKRLVEYRQNKT